ncbi:NHL repeat domain protein [hydrothermal vent metagenome]|uniref:NHL repeat domain protein n=1 Tax=hydrothermal vent metagenome TaxID=652676 RepID=A0A3B0Z9A2_9ZZZZ
MRNVPYKINTRLKRLGVVTVIAGLMLSLTGCSNQPQQPEFIPPVFPPPPAEPRFVYERTLRFANNIIKPSRTERLKRFATGVALEQKGLIKPYDVAVKNGRIYITDTVQKSILVFDIPGGRYFEFGAIEPGGLQKPTGIDIADNGDIFVSDVEARRVMVYSAEGQYLRSIGHHEQLKRPSDVTIDSNNKLVYVVDTGGVDSQQHRIAVYDLDSGDLLRTIGTRGQQTGNFNIPLQASVASNGLLYVVDSGNFRIQAFDHTGNFKHSFGSLGRYPGQFARPKGIAIDPDNNIYVVDTAFGNFQIFNPAGELLLFIGQRGQTSKPTNYMLPAGIDIDKEGRIYIVDQFFRKVDIYRPVSVPPLSEMKAQQ